jgi:flavodoxin
MKEYVFLHDLVNQVIKTGVIRDFSAELTIAMLYQASNIRVIANQIHESIDGDIFEIVTLDPYPSDYNKVVKQEKQEQESGYKPTLKTKVENIESYDIVFIGCPK